MDTPRETSHNLNEKKNNTNTHKMKLPSFLDLALGEHICIYIMPSESGQEVKVRTLKNKCKHAPPLHATTITTTTTTTT
jgi:hypothetical protein